MKVEAFSLVAAALAKDDQRPFKWLSMIFSTDQQGGKMVVWRRRMLPAGCWFKNAVAS